MGMGHRLVALAIALLLAACSGQGPAQTAGSPGPTGSASPSGPATSAGSAGDLDAAISGLGLPTASGLTITAADVRTNGDWSAITAGPSTNDPAHPVAPFTMVIGHRVNGVWQLVSERDGAAFCAALDAAPTDLGTASMRAYYGGCQ